MKAAVAGASGFVGRKLAERLAADGHHVVALARRERALPHGPGIEPRQVDVRHEDALVHALTGCDVAYYLIHSMTERGFEQTDLLLARTFARAAARAGIERIVYLGGIVGDGPRSRHLGSREEVGRALGSNGVPVVELRAGVVLGSGSISFEMLRYLVERLPVMVCPRWVRTSIEPIAEQDVLEYLVQAAGVDAGIYEIGCGTVTSYRELMDVYASVRGLRKRLILDVPLLTLRLSSYWVDIVTPVDTRISHALIESLASEVVVRHGEPTRKAFDVAPMPLREAVHAALDEQATGITSRLFDTPPGLESGVYFVRVSRRIDPAGLPPLRTRLAQAGGDLHWYGVAGYWRLRLLLGNLFGEHNHLHRPDHLETGANVDWWTVEHAEPDSLVLRSRSWFNGDGWLGYSIRGGSLLEQVAAFRPKGLLGFLYWKIAEPIHTRVFDVMANHFAAVTRAPGTRLATRRRGSVA